MGERLLGAGREQLATVEFITGDQRKKYGHKDAPKTIGRAGEYFPCAYRRLEGFSGRLFPLLFAAKKKGTGFPVPCLLWADSRTGRLGS